MRVCIDVRLADEEKLTEPRRRQLSSLGICSTSLSIPRAPVAVARLKQTGHRAETCKGGSRGEATSNPVWKRSCCGTQEWHPRFSAPSSTIFWSQLFLSLRARSGAREESFCHLTIRFRFPVAGWGVAWGCASRHFTRIADGRWDAFLAQSPHPWQLLGSNESWSKSRKKRTRIASRMIQKSVGSLACLESPKEVAVVRVPASPRCPRCPEERRSQEQEMRDASAG